MQIIAVLFFCLQLVQAADPSPVFSDAGTGASGSWKDLYFQDGAKGIINNTPEGLQVMGPDSGDSGHTIVWTKKILSGPVVVEFDYKRKDEHRNGNATLILMHAVTAPGKCPTDKKSHPSDIASWARPISKLRFYYDCIYNQSVNIDGGRNDDPRVSLRQNTGGQIAGFVPAHFFEADVWYHLTITRTDKDISVKAVNAATGVQEYSYSKSFKASYPLSSSGHFGLRSMAGRNSIFRNIVVRPWQP